MKNVPKTRSSSDSEESLKSAATGESAGNFSAFPELNCGARALVAEPPKDVADVAAAPSVGIIAIGSRQSSKCASGSTGNFSPAHK